MAELFQELETAMRKVVVARDRLQAAGARVLYREARMFHGIDPVFIHVLQNWLADLARDVPALERGS